MSEFKIEVAGGSSVRLPTAGKYCDRDIVVTATGGGSTGGGSTGGGGSARLQTKTITANGTYYPDSGYDGLSYVDVAVPTGGYTGFGEMNAYKESDVENYTVPFYNWNGEVVIRVRYTEYNEWGGMEQETGVNFAPYVLERDDEGNIVEQKIGCFTIGDGWARLDVEDLYTYDDMGSQTNDVYGFTFVVAQYTVIG